MACPLPASVTRGYGSKAPSGPPSQSGALPAGSLTTDYRLRLKGPFGAPVPIRSVGLPAA
jgi:hypothetical protein